VVSAELIGVLIELTDFNGADVIFAASHVRPWGEIADALAEIPPHLKASDQADKIGAPIWDAVGNNAAIKDGLVARSWKPNLPIRAPYAFLGTDVDFVKRDTVIEVQFSNYPSCSTTFYAANYSSRARSNSTTLP